MQEMYSKDQRSSMAATFCTLQILMQRNNHIKKRSMKFLDMRLGKHIEVRATQTCPPDQSQCPEGDALAHDYCFHCLSLKFAVLWWAYSINKAETNNRNYHNEGIKDICLKVYDINVIISILKKVSDDLH